MDFNITFGAALIAGAISFVSPCVLPLVPPYLCYVSGLSLEDMTRDDAEAPPNRNAILFAALCFVLGFTTVFVLLGATASYAGQMLRSYLPLLTQLSGIAIIIMGLHFLGLFKIGFLSRDVRYHGETGAGTYYGAYGLGLAFAFGWTPCIGPILATILTVASNSESVTQGMQLLTVYSLGLGIPFLLAAFSMNAFLRFFRRFRSKLGLVEKIMGGMLVVTGIMFLTGAMQTLSYWLLDLFPSLATIG
jgi:cytochrome c-type biogenesis protein